MNTQRLPLKQLRMMFGPLGGRTSHLIVTVAVWAALLLPAPIASAATSYYVAPDGLPSNNGSLTQPLDLVTALSSQGPVRPGDTVWLRGGVYRRVAAPDANGDTVLYVSTLNGTAAAPIVVRQYPGERATLDGNLSPTIAVLVVNGTYTSFWGFEITNSDPNRYAVRGDGIDSYGHHNKFINLVIHDTGQGVGFWATTAPNESELYGSLIYNVGFEAPDRGHGHSVYVQNVNGTKRMVDNILFNGFSFGIHAYTENGRIDNLWIEGNMFFNHGILSVTGGPKANLIFAGNQIAQNPTVRGNFGYYPAGSAGRSVDVSGCNNGTFQTNYLAGGTPLNVSACTNTVVSNNTLYGPVSSAVMTAYPNNLYGTTPTGLFVGVRPNVYEPGRANVVVYNWARQPQVAVDLSGAGLAAGDRYEVRDAQNYFGGPVATGTYTGATVSLPMTGLSAAPVVGNGPIQPGHTDTEFAVFVVQRLDGGGTGAVPTASLATSLLSLVAGQSATLSWTTTGATSVSINQGVGAVGASGSSVVTPQTTITYTLTATNATGATTRTVTIAVTPSAGSPDGTMVPQMAAQIVDNQGAVWTIGANQAILRNGVLAAAAYGTKILWTGGTIYVLGLDNNWWKWLGSGWTNIGPTRPGAPAAPTNLRIVKQ